MRDVGLCIMAQNDADLLTDNLQALREDLTYSNDESGADLARRLRHGLQKVGALLSTAHKARTLVIATPMCVDVCGFLKFFPTSQKPMQT